MWVAWLSSAAALFLGMTEFHIVDQLKYLNFGQGSAHQRQTTQSLSDAETEELVFVVRQSRAAAPAVVERRPSRERREIDIKTR